MTVGEKESYRLHNGAIVRVVANNCNCRTIVEIGIRLLPFHHKLLGRAEAI